MRGFIKTRFGKLSLFVVAMLVMTSLSLTLWKPNTVTATRIALNPVQTTWTVPAGVGSVQVECWGGGGAGGGGNTDGGPGGGGGGGGAYARENAYSVTPGQTYNYSIGAAASGGTGNGADGATSTFETTGGTDICAAPGGQGGLAASNGTGPDLGGNGGASTTAVGDVAYKGGDGGDSSTLSEDAAGGGGGSAATSTTDGNDGGNAGTIGVAGAAPDGPGGAGGAGGATGVNPAPSGNAYGGGGGGGGERDGGSEAGGSGAQGAIVLTYTADTSPPTPNPPTYATGLTALSTSSMTMTATAASDTNSVEYNLMISRGNITVGFEFHCDFNTDAGNGNTSSGWQSSTSYTDTGLEANQCYQYFLWVRDSVGNYTATTSSAEVYTHAHAPGKLDYTKKTATTITIYNNANGNPSSNPTTNFAVFASSTDDANWDGFYITSSGATTTTETWMSDAAIDGTTLSNMATGTQYQFDVIARNEDGIRTATTTSYIKTAPAGTASSTVLTSGSGTWTVPDGVTEVQVQCWGAGGGGGAGFGPAGGGGGGGGAFAKVDSYITTPSSGISYVIGASSNASTTFGGDVCNADNGSNGSAGSSGGSGGQASVSVGDWIYSGGSGSMGALAVGGGGGGGATSTSNGNDTTSSAAGAAAFGPGGAGGAGGADTNTEGGNGSLAGGGGGGDGSSLTSGSLGAAGKIELHYWLPPPDTDPPSPDPLHFTTAPTSTTAQEVTMTVVTATDDSTPIEYYFTATTSDCGLNYGTGANDSGWQTSTSYTDTGLEVNHCYGYMVTARDAEGNYTATSTASSTYTLANTPGLLTFTNQTENTITIENNENGNPASNPATEFLLVVTSIDTTWNNRYINSSGNPSASETWLTDTQLDNLTLNSMASGTTYTFRVKARNGDGTETPYTEPHSFFTVSANYTRLRGGTRLNGVRVE